MPEQLFAQSANNPVIEKQGSAVVGPFLFCTWKTNNGSASILNIVNPSSNTLYFVVSGAPAGQLTTKGNPLNGAFEIPPNSPTSNVQAIGDFQGVTVTIANTTNQSIPADCKVTVTVQGG